jgi:hypothetical protein
MICETFVTIISGLPRYRVIFPDTATVLRAKLINQEYSTTPGCIACRRLANHGLLGCQGGLAATVSLEARGKMSRMDLFTATEVSVIRPLLVRR